MIHTFVIAAYGESQYLEECIRSLKNQTLKSEIKIATSTDNDFIRGLARKYDLPLYINEDGGSLGKDWNYCLSLGDTPLVTIAHQDDVYAKDYSRQITNAFYLDPEAAIYFTGYHEIRDGQVVVDNANLRIKRTLLAPFAVYPSKSTQRLGIALGCAICCPSVAYNMLVLEDFEFDTDLRSNLDWKAWADLYESGHRFSYIPKAVTLHRIHDESETHKVIEDGARSQEDEEVLGRFWPKPVAGLINKVYSLSERSN